MRSLTEEELGEEQDTEYVFQIGEPRGVVKCLVGGVEINDLIDSGTRRNLITAEKWADMKRMKVKVEEMKKGSDVSFKAYGQNEMIPVLGRFRAWLELNGKKALQWFYVVEKEDLCLLGEETSVEHDVLKVGTTVRSVAGGDFPKIKGNDIINLL